MKKSLRIQEKTYSYGVHSLYRKAVEPRTTTLDVDSITGLECKYFPKKTLEPDQVPRGGKKRGSVLWPRW